MLPDIYKPIDLGQGLQQGDIIAKSAAVVGVLEKAFPDEALAKASAFIILTQSCDLFRRGKKSCRAKYVNLATISPLEDNLFMLLDDICDKVCLEAEKPISGLYLLKDKNKAEQFIERVLNQTEERRGLFYLPPLAEAGIGVHSIVNLQVNAPVRIEHYDFLISNAKGRLGIEYQHRLGWLVGNLFSRVALPEFDKSEKDRIIKEMLTPEEGEAGPFWVSRDSIAEAQRKGIGINGKKNREVYDLLESLKPNPPKERALERIRVIVREEADISSEDILKRISDRLNQDGVFHSSIKRQE